MLSRVADNLYWLSRYLERAEHMARVLDVNLQRMLEQDAESASRRWDRLLRSLRISTVRVASRDPYEVTRALAFDATSVESIVSCVAAARENARQVREQISSEMWEQINRLYLQMRSVQFDTIWQGEPHRFFREVIMGSHLFEGITDSTMTHGEGWLFVQVGRYIERAQATAVLLDVTLRDLGAGSDQSPRVDDYYEWISLLKSCTAFEAYCRQYTADLRPDRIAEFLLLNAEFPHSVHFAAIEVQKGLEAISAPISGRLVARVNRLAGRLRAQLGFGQIDEILAGDIHAYLTDIQRQCAQIEAAVRHAFVAYPIETALAS